MKEVAQAQGNDVDILDLTKVPADYLTKVLIHIWLVDELCGFRVEGNVRTKEPPPFPSSSNVITYEYREVRYDCVYGVTQERVAFLIIAQSNNKMRESAVIDYPVPTNILQDDENLEDFAYELMSCLTVWVDQFLKVSVRGHFRVRVPYGSFAGSDFSYVPCERTADHSDTPTVNLGAENPPAEMNDVDNPIPPISDTSAARESSQETTHDTIPPISDTSAARESSQETSLKRNCPNEIDPAELRPGPSKSSASSKRPRSSSNLDSDES
ncbi:hypothetical protein V9T40_001293 [Parthenolecanium corni]|uniref:Uncharacterized protein n=1 Tax=Parthenolecanium corni TaxID=536013 RepID=A0AAN9Y180_9HEMI